MVSLLLPFIALLAVVKATNFKGDDVKVNFMLRDTPGHPHQFEDITPYASAESKKTLSKTGDANSGIAGQLIFTKTEDWRQIKWSGAGSNGTLFEKKCDITMPVEPETDSNLIYMLLTGEVRSGSGYLNPEDPDYDDKEKKNGVWPDGDKVKASCIDEKF